MALKEQGLKTTALDIDSYITPQKPMLLKDCILPNSPVVSTLYPLIQRMELSPSDMKNGRQDAQGVRSLRGYGRLGSKSWLCHLTSVVSLGKSKNVLF